MVARIEIRNSAFAEMAVGPEIAAAVTAEAKRAEGIAKGIAEDFRVSGEYSESFVVTTETTRLRTGFGEHDVVAGKVENIARDAKGFAYAAAVEWGDKHDHRAHHVLGRTLDALGHD